VLIAGMLDSPLIRGVLLSDYPNRDVSGRRGADVGHLVDAGREDDQQHSPLRYRDLGAGGRKGRVVGAGNLYLFVFDVLGSYTLSDGVRASRDETPAAPPRLCRGA